MQCKRLVLSILLTAFTLLTPGVARNAASKQANDPWFNAFAALGPLYEDVASSQEELSYCVKERNYFCLLHYKTQRAAVKRIFDEGREVALARTIEGLQKYCRLPKGQPGEDPSSRLYPCYGALDTLFLFAAPAEDDKIRQAFATFDPALIKHIFIDAGGCTSLWCMNRPGRKAWSALADTWTVLDESKDANNSRESLRGIFDGGPFSPSSSLSLLVPEYQLDPKLEARIEATLKPTKYYADMQRMIASFEAGPKKPERSAKSSPKHQP